MNPLCNVKKVFYTNVGFHGKAGLDISNAVPWPGAIRESFRSHERLNTKLKQQRPVIAKINPGNSKCLKIVFTGKRLYV